MAKILGLERVLGWFWQRPAAQDFDAADMGTAFGMELSFRPNDETAGDPEPDPPAAPRTEGKDRPPR